MTTAINEHLIIQAARSDATGYVDLGNAAARKLDRAFAINTPEMTEGTFRGRSDGLRSTIATLEERMVMGTTVEIESAIRAVLGAVRSVEEFLSPPSPAKPVVGLTEAKAPPKPAPSNIATKITATTDATPRTCRCNGGDCS
jgi:hypothetical protein